MESISIRQAREKFRELIDGAEQGESIAITRRGRKVAVLVPPQPQGGGLPDLADFRASILLSAGSSLSNTVIELRDNERY